MNEEIKKWRSIKNELASRKIDFLELDSEDLCDYGNDTPHAITLNVDDDTMDDEDLVFALRKIGNSYIIQYGEDLLESDEDRDVSAKEMVDFVEREIKKANESLNGTAVSNYKYKVHATDIEYDLDEEDGDPDLPKEITLLVESDVNKDDPYFSDVVCNAIEDEVGWMVKSFRYKVVKENEANESLIDDESHNIELSSDKAAKFIKESVEWLLQEEMGCCTKELTPEVQLAVGWLNGYDPEDTTLIHSKEDPTWCICVGIVAADGDDMKTDLEWLTIPYVADGENKGDVFSELMEPLSPNDNYAKVFEYLAKEYEGILKEYDVHSDGKCFHKKRNVDIEESIKPKKGKGGLTFKEKCRAAQRGFKYSPDMDYLMYEDEDMVIASDEDHIPSWYVLNSGDYDLYGREVTEDDTYLDDGTPILMSSMLYDGPWEKFTIRNGHVVGREPTDEQPA